MLYRNTIYYYFAFRCLSTLTPASIVQSFRQITHTSLDQSNDPRTRTPCLIKHSDPFLQRTSIRQLLALGLGDGRCAKPGQFQDKLVNHLDMSHLVCRQAAVSHAFNQLWH